MPQADIIKVVLLLYGLEAVLGVALAALFLHYDRAYRRVHLRLWAASFALLGAYFLFAGAAFAAVNVLRDWPTVRHALSLASQVAAYLQIGLLVLGTVTLLRGEEPSRRALAVVIAFGVGLGTLATFAYIDNPAAVRERLFVRVTLRYLLTGLAYLGVAYAMSRRARRGDVGMGHRLVAFAMALYGMVAATNFALDELQVASRSMFTLVPWMGVVDLVAMGFIGFGLVVWLLEDERDRADAAARTVQQLTQYDAVTGLPNRRHFQDHLASTLTGAAPGERLALLAIEPDRARLLHESIGDLALERALVDLAGRLHNTVEPERELLARYEGDRFVLVSRGVVDAEHAARRAAQLLKQARAPLRTGQGGHYATLSIGIALYPRDAREGDALSRAAALALARAQHEGGNGYRFYARELDELARARIELQNAVRRALERDEFVLHFQPVLDTRSGTPVAFEALLRWQHPERGLLLPGEFLHAVEDAGAIGELDEWVLGRACRQLAAWRGEGLDDVRIAINISAPSFESAVFPETVARQLERSGVPPAQLELEITEAMAVRDAVGARAAIDRLKALGVCVTLDDFGVGFSSLAQLRQLAADKLKIDGGFTATVAQDPKTAAIVGAMITLAHNLGLRVVAEGVETEAQLAFYRARGVFGVQGFLFDAALPPEAAGRLWAGQADSRADSGAA